MLISKRQNYLFLPSPTQPSRIAWLQWCMHRCRKDVYCGFLHVITSANLNHNHWIPFVACPLEQIRTSNGVQGRKESSNRGEILCWQNSFGRQVYKEPIQWAVTLSTGRCIYIPYSIIIGISPINTSLVLLNFMLTKDAVIKKLISLFEFLFSTHKAKRQLQSLQYLKLIDMMLLWHRLTLNARCLFSFNGLRKETLRSHNSLLFYHWRFFWWSIARSIRTQNRENRCHA